jgi:uncharacterized protein
LKTNFRFSKFCHFFEKNGFIALYHSLSHEIVYLSCKEYEKVSAKIEKGDQIKEKNNKIINRLMKYDMVVPKTYNEKDVLEKIRQEEAKKQFFGILYLLITDHCNLGCSYCFVEGSFPKNHIPRKMSPKTAINALRLFSKVWLETPEKNRPTELQIFFYGGEPLLNKEVFFLALEEIERLKKSGKLPRKTIPALNTNGTKISREIVKKIKKYNVSVSVSLDGPQLIHDQSRAFLNGKGSFQAVKNGIETLINNGINPGVSCTINKANLENLKESFQWITEEMGIKQMGFNLLINLPDLIQNDEFYAQKATEQIIECYKIAREKGVYEDRIMRKIKTFIQKSIHFGDCAGYGHQMVVAPNGEIGPCHAFFPSGNKNFFPGSVDHDDFDPFSDSVFQEWKNRLTINMKECFFCEAIGICGGGCAYNSTIKSGTIWEVDASFCVHTKMILEWLIWDLFEKSA